MTQIFDLQRPLIRALAIMAAIGCAALIAYGSLSPPDDVPSVTWSDKINHFIAYMCLSGPLLVAAGRERWLTMIALATAYGALMELAQGTFDAGRTADLFDAIANGLGACAGVAIGYAMLSASRS